MQLHKACPAGLAPVALFFFAARGHLEVTAGRGAATFLTWTASKRKLVTQAEQALALFPPLFFLQFLVGRTRNETRTWRYRYRHVFDIKEGVSNHVGAVRRDAKKAEERRKKKKKGPPSNIWTTASIGTAKEVVIRPKKEKKR